MNLQGKEVLVAGAGKSGMAAAKLLLDSGVDVILFDENPACDKEKAAAALGHEGHVEILTGKLPDEVVERAACMVISPGISIEAPFTAAFRSHNIPIWSEVELAYRFGAGRLCAITGTNGKTTTTTLVGEILKAYYDSVFVVGNIGQPYTGVALQMRDDSVSVAEISSFQLESIVDFHPEVSAILNVTPDHLNRHHTMEIYADTKREITFNQTSDEVCVLNYDDPITRAMAQKIRPRTVFFSRTQKLDDGFVCDGQSIVRMQAGNAADTVCQLSELKLLGSHNIENVMAAAAVAYYMDVPMPVIHKVITEFTAVAHRIEYVDTINGVDYYNDSKGTNPDAAIKGIQAMVKPTYLIGGGYDKGVAFDDWIASFDGKVRALVLFGATAEQIEAAARAQNFTDIVRVADLSEAVQVCARQAQSGEAVLLSPACASWDMFDSYEQRGDLFKEYVRALKE